MKDLATLSQIELWLKKHGISYRRVSANQLIVYQRHDLAYGISLTEQPGWFSYAAVVLSRVDGQKVHEFNDWLLGMSARTNGFALGYEGNDIVLSRDDYDEDLTEYALLRGISSFNRAHKQLGKEISAKAIALGLRFKR